MRLPTRFLAICLWLATNALASAAPPACDISSAREKVRLGRVGERLDIVLADGRLVYFPNLEPPRATAAGRDRPKDVTAQLTSLLANKTLLLLSLGGPDRWGRIPARLFVEGDSEAADEALAAAGLAMASANPAACGVASAEAAAREAKLGIWADPAFAVLAADDAAGLSARSGVLTLVEGQIRSVGHSVTRTYLNFAGRRGGVSLVIAKRNLGSFERAGLAPKSLVSRRIRVRGVVEIGAAPQIELFHPAQIEFMEEAPRTGRP